MGFIGLPLLDSGFDACARESFAAKHVRIRIATVLALVCATGLGWKVMAIWFGAVALQEGVGAYLNQRHPYPEYATRRRRTVFIVQLLLGSVLWQLPSIMMWLSGSPALQMAAVVQWLANLFYVQLYSAKSRSFALISAAPPIAVVAALALLASPFHGRAAIAPTVILLMALANAGLGLAGAVRRHEMLAAAMAARDASERDLIAARDAEHAASQAKSEFLANMSHEIRTPLNGVMGVAGALARTELSPSQQEMVTLIETSAKTLETLLSDILDLARIEAGKMELRPEPFDLVASVNACAALFDPAAQAKGLDFAVAIAPEALGAYVGDAPRIRQILANLLGNAVKFTQAGRVKLAVTARRGETASQLRFEVRDTGIGFDAETKARLFSRFEQADGSITRRFGGSGLGLSISRSLAEAMGGRLEGDATPGEGAVFTLVLELPRCEGALDLSFESAEPEPAANPLVGLRVLLAEDHPANRRVVELILGAAGVNLTCVENGVEAVDTFSRSAFDLVLMDMQMPLMDGLTAIGEIRRIEGATGAPPTPIHVLTANAMPEHISASLEAGADGHLSKPILADQLLRRVAEAAAHISRPLEAKIA